MEFKELKNKKKEDLKALSEELREKIRALRFKDANKQLKDVREIRETKKDLARILMLLNEPKK